MARTMSHRSVKRGLIGNDRDWWRQRRQGQRPQGNLAPTPPPLEMVTYLKHLGRVISAADDDWPTVVQNLVKMKTMYQRMSRILIREGARPQVSGFFFKSAVQ